MRHSNFGWAAAAAVMLLAAWGGATGVRNAEPEWEQPASSGPDAVLDATISRFRERAGADPFSAGDQAMLAQALLQRARETGSYEDVLAAEAAARRSLRLREAHNAPTWGILSIALVEQHRFVEARAAAETLLAADPGSLGYRANLGEIELELGDYDAAATVFRSLEGSRGELDVAPRMAHWLEVTGRPDEARALLYAARRQALAQLGATGERAAWYHLRVGDIELRHGRLDEAEKALNAGLVAFPGDHRILAAMARLQAARGEWARSIQYGEAVIGTVLDPSTLILMSDAALARGDSARSAEYAHVLQVSVAGQKTAYHRDWGLFLLDRGVQVEQVLDRARSEIRTRPDIYGYDLLAWAYHEQGRDEEARVAMRLALRTGARDAMLLYHAGMIEHSLGRDETARRYLADALRVNPRFHPIHAATARRTLGVIRRHV